MLAPGHHLYRGADGAWRYSAPGNVFVRITGDDELLSQVLNDEIHGSDIEAIRATLLERGVLATSEPPRIPDDWRLHVEGDGPIAKHLVELIGPQHCTIGVLDEQSIAATDAIVACGQWLPDQRWQQVDKWCSAHGTPWHRCYVEGTTFVLGPLSIPDRTASYHDTRGRILAAAPLPDELSAFWSYLDSGASAPTTMLTPEAISVTAGLLAADIRALATGMPVPSEGHQLMLDMSTATVTRHRVLPLPDLAA